MINYQILSPFKGLISLLGTILLLPILFMPKFCLLVTILNFSLRTELRMWKCQWKDKDNNQNQYSCCTALLYNIICYYQIFKYF